MFKQLLEIRIARFILALFISFFVNPVQAQELDYGNLPEHPRLFLTKGQEKAVRNTIKKKKNRYLLEAHYESISIADQTLGLPPCKWPGEGHILSTSREILKRIFNLSYAFRMTGDYSYANRAEEEMLNACLFPHWDPAHYLDTAELTFGMAIGYDWLFDYLSEGSKELIRQSILEKAFLTAESSNGYKAGNNWNSVCNAGLVAGAAAVFESYPDQARERVEKALKFNPIVLNTYAPDGAYPEGYSYWSYGTGYQVMMISILEDCFGSCGELDKYPGFLQTGYYLQMMCSPTGHCFSYSDSEDKQVCNLFLLWFSKRLGDPSLVYLEKQILEKGNVNYGIESRFLPIILIWASQQDLDTISQPKMNVWSSKGTVPLFIYRSGWDNPEDTYLGVKGGMPSASHGHMDSGEFYYEKGGVIWAKDMGGQSYGTFYKNNVNCWDPSQDGDRWGIWRNCTSMHNVITVNEGRHLAIAFSDISSTIDSAGVRGCIVELTEALSLQLDSAVRTVRLSDDDHVLTIEDFVQAKKEEDAHIYWNMTTCAEGKVISQNEILLTSGKKSMRMVITSPSVVEPVVLSTKSPFSWDVQNPGTCRVGFKTTLPAGNTEKLTVKLIYNK